MSTTAALIVMAPDHSRALTESERQHYARTFNPAASMTEGKLYRELGLKTRRQRIRARRIQQLARLAAYTLIGTTIPVAAGAAMWLYWFILKA